jgi:TonB-dependent SusC/RagA subfamily outer membrane receptor
MGMRGNWFILFFLLGLGAYAQPGVKNAPLYVINGKVYDAGLLSIKPQDIESIDIAKDANAVAAYGPAGVHGVVFIKTKAYIFRKFAASIGTFSKPYSKYIKEHPQSKLAYYLNDSLIADTGKFIIKELYNLPKSSIQKVKFVKPRLNKAGTVNITTKP